MNNPINPSEKEIARFFKKINKDGPLWTNPETGEQSHCWIWTAALSKDGYGLLVIQNLHVIAHRVSYTIHNGPIPDGMLGCHRCDNPPCCNPLHIFLGTSDTNNKDMKAKGRTARGDANGSRKNPERMPRGERHGSKTHPEAIRRGDNHPIHLHPECMPRGEKHHSTKNTTSEIIEMRRLRREEGLSYIKIGKRFNVSKDLARRVCLKLTWGHVPD